MIASTLVGGEWGEAAEGIAVDERGRVFLTGATYSKNFPLTTGFLASMGGGEAPQAFFLVFSPKLDKILYSTFVTEGNTTIGRSAAVSHDGNEFVMGGVREWNESTDGFLVKFSLKDKISDD